MKYLLSWLALLSLVATPALANPCGTSGCFVRKRAAVVIKKEIVVQPTAVFVPSYIATIAPYAVAAPLYAPPPPPPQAPVAAPAPVYPQPAAVQYGALQATQVQAVQAQAAAPITCTAEMVEALRAINQRLCALEQQRAGAAPPPIAPAPAMAPRAPRSPSDVPGAFGKCVACHTAGKLKGTTFEMFKADGSLAALNARQLLRIATKTSLGEMPPPGNREGVPPVTDQESAEIQTWLNAQK